MNRLRIDHIDPAKLTANNWNTNVVSPDNEHKLLESIRRFGLFKPILVREVDGKLEVLGGEHRLQAAIAEGYTTVPVINLGVIDDRRAKEISLVDNGRYGEDDTLQLAQLLETLGDASEIASFMPYDNKELETIFSSMSIAIDDLEMTDEDERPSTPAPTKKTQDYQIMRFKVPVEDAAIIRDAVAEVIKEQKLTDPDSLLIAGLALLQIVNKAKDD